MATRIDVKSTSTLTGTSITLSGADTLIGAGAGDTIIIFVSCPGIGTEPSRQMTDNLGNTYTIRMQTEPGNGSGFGFTWSYTSVVTFPGNPQPTYQDDRNDGRFMTGFIYRNLGILTSPAQQEGHVDRNALTGRQITQTSPMAFADSTTVTALMAYSADATPPTNPSPSGESLVNTENALTSYQFTFEQFRTTLQPPARVQLEYYTFNFDSISIVSLTFSRPFARPADFTEQAAIQPGVGFDDNEPDFPVNRPLSCLLPYEVALGDAVFVGGGWFSDVSSTLSDTYGNTWTVRVTSTAPTADQGSTRWWSTILTHLPPAGEIFLVTMSPTIPGTGQPYQTSALGIYSIPRTPATYQGFEFDDYVENDPVVQIRTTEAVSVPAGTLLLVFVAYGVSINQQAAEWQEALGFSIKASWDIIQVSMQSGIINTDRFSPCAVLTQEVAASGNYRGVGQAEIDGNFNAAGSIVMLAITIASTLRLVKVVSGGAAVTTDWTLSADGPTPISGAGGVGPSTVTPGDYALSEVGGAGTENYTPSPWVCVGGTQVGDAVTIAAGDTVVCTITNTSITPEPPEVCIINPIATPTPSFVTYPEPREQQGS